MKSEVILTQNTKEFKTHNKFTEKFKNRLVGWLSSSSSIDKRRQRSPFYMAVGLGNSLGERTSLEAEALRIPISAKFIEPVSARTRITAQFNTTDISSIPWKEIGLFDEKDKSIYLNKCDSIGKWGTDSEFRLYASEEGSVQDSAALFCELVPKSNTTTVFSSLDLTDGLVNSIKDATSTELRFSKQSHVTSAFTRTATNPIIIGNDTDTSSSLATRGAVFFDLSGLPSDSVITSVKLNCDITYVKGVPQINIGPYGGNADTDFSNDTPTVQYGNSVLSTYYVSGSNQFEEKGEVEIDLGSVAVTDINTSLSGSTKRFTIAINEEEDTAGERVDIADSTLMLEYTRTLSLGINGKELSQDGDFLQFFMFIGAESITTNGNFLVTLSSSETANTDQWKWTLREESIKNGWNFFQLPLGEATKTGTPVSSHIKRFQIEADGGITNSGILGLDNIRLFRPSGNLLNRVVFNEGYIKSVGSSVTVQWIIDLDLGV